MAIEDDNTISLTMSLSWTKLIINPRLRRSNSNRDSFFSCSSSWIEDVSSTETVSCGYSASQYLWQSDVMTLVSSVARDKSLLRDSQIAVLELVRLIQTRRKLNVAFRIDAFVSHDMTTVPSVSNSDIPCCNIGLKGFTC